MRTIPGSGTTTELFSRMGGQAIFNSAWAISRMDKAENVPYSEGNNMIPVS